MWPTMHNILGLHIWPSLLLYYEHPLGRTGVPRHCGQSACVWEPHAKALKGVAASQQQRGMEAAERGSIQKGCVFTPVFLSMKFIQKGLFRVCFFSQFLEKIQNKTHCEAQTTKKMGFSWQLLKALYPLQKLHYDFLKMGEGPKAVRNFSKNSSVLEGEGIPP